MSRDEALRQHANTILAAMDRLSEGGFAARDPTRKMLAHFAIRKAAEETLLILGSPCACEGREPIVVADCWLNLPGVEGKPPKEWVRGLTVYPPAEGSILKHIQVPVRVLVFADEWAKEPDGA